MKIQIINVRDSSPKLTQQYLQQIAAWHFHAWGEITGRPLTTFERDITKQFNEKKAEYFIAVEETNGECLGTISLKQRNMEDEYPDHGWGPWFSGLYVREQNRHQGISAMLGLKAALLAQKNDAVSIYYFTHNLDLADFYNKLKGEEVKAFPKNQYTYLGKPILVYRAKPEALVKILETYLKKIDLTSNQALPENKNNLLKAKL
jgi:hypothetical protein